MADDVQCPYCGHGQEINHDDGYGYEEGFKHSQQCSECDKYFVYETHISFSYSESKADCLNDADHNFKPNTTYPKEFTRFECTECGERRDPTAEELKLILEA